MSSLRERKERLALALRERSIRENRKRQSNPKGGLIEFVRYFWHILVPQDEMIEGWAMECLCAHLEAVTNKERIDINGFDRMMNRLLVNVPPGFSKSLLTNVFWPAWEWGPRGLPHLQYLAFSYSPELTQRDNDKFRRIIQSEEYQELWGHVFALTGDGKIRITNDKTGFKFATSFGGVGTGERGHRVLLDDPHKLQATQQTPEARESITNWVREAMQNRLNDIQRDAIVIIMQRLHDDDTSGVVLKHLGHEYCSLIIPMEFEHGRHFSHFRGWNDGFDPRIKEGELAWPERFTRDGLASFKANAYLWAGQYQQIPVPRGGGIFKEDWFKVHPLVQTGSGSWSYQPEIRPLYVMASLDTAFSEKEENDYSALTVWVVYDDPITKFRRILLADAWQKRLPELAGDVPERLPGETYGAWVRRTQETWGLCDWVAYTCRRRKATKLIVENKTRGPDVIRALRKHFAGQDWSVEPFNIQGDKWSRANALVDLYTDGMIHVPARISDNDDIVYLDWVDMAIREFTVFPRGQHDDLVDSMTMALKYLRDRGWAVRKEEYRREEEDRRSRSHAGMEALYPA